MMKLNILVMGTGGSQKDTFINRRLKALASIGMEVITPVSGNLEMDPGISNRVKTLWMDKHRSLFSYLRDWVLFGIQHPYRSLRLLRALLAQSQSIVEFLVLSTNALQLARLDPDIVHFEWNSAAVDHKWMFDYFDCPTVISCRGRQVNIWPHMPGKEKFIQDLKDTFKKTSAVHCVSRSVLQECLGLGLAPRKGNVIYTAVDTGFYTPNPNRTTKQDKAIHITMVGALIWRKGFEYAIMALKSLLDQGLDVYLDIVGDGPELDRIEYTAKDLNIFERVNLIGRLDPDQVRDALWQADIFLLTSLSEGIANVVVEAMSCGLPIVSTDCGGMREAITEGVEGFLVPVRDGAATAAALMRLIKDPQLRVAMGAAGRQRALRSFTLETQAEKFCDLYQRLIGLP
ncbi:MAG TPA: glycosyltransferase family 4 protein [Anaerolineales bacterium]|nr:glycosyltransferase family 4 protein [Anaerolineales bacterium]